MAVRRPLLAGGKTLQIKACALSNGFGIWASLRPCMPPNLAKHRQQLWLARSSGYHEKWGNRPHSSLGLGPKAWFAKQQCKDYAKFRSHSWRRV